MKTRQKKISLAVKAALIVPIGLAALTPNLGSANSFSSQVASGSWSFANSWAVTAISAGTTTTPGATTDTALIDRSGGSTISAQGITRSISTVTVGTSNAANRLNVGTSSAATITAGSGVTVGSGGSIYVGSGVATGILSTGSSVTNSGTIFTGNVGVVSIAGNLTNSGTYTSSGAGSLRVGSITNNSGVLSNTGVSTLTGAVTNTSTGIVTNSGTLSTGAYTNSGSTTNAAGTATLNSLANSGTFANNSGANLVVTNTTTNSGVITNAGTATLTGAVGNGASGFVTNTGTLSTGAYTNAGNTNNSGTLNVTGSLGNSNIFTTTGATTATGAVTNTGGLTIDTASGKLTATGGYAGNAGGSTTISNGGELTTAGFLNAAGATTTVNTGGKLNASGPITSGGTFTANGATVNSGTGVVNVTGGTFTLTNTSTDATTLSNTGGTVTLTNSGDKIVVANDYQNSSFGSGNSFDRLAGVTGNGAIIAKGDGGSVADGAQRQTISGAGVVGGGIGQNATIAFGNKHVGDAAQTVNYNINNNQGTSGPTLRGAIQTVGSIDGRLSGSGVNPTGVGSTAYTAGIANGGAIGGNAVTFNATSSGALSSQLNVVNNFDQTKQAINITGAAYAYAGASVAGSVSVGAQHVGNNNAGGVAANIAVTNTGTGATGFVENLGGSATANPSAVLIGSNTISGIAAGGSNNSLQVGVDTASAGAKTGSVQVALTSETIAGGLSNTSLSSSTTSVTGNVYDYANAVFEKTSGSGTVAQVGTTPNFTLSYGNVNLNSAVSTILDVKNLALAGFADLLGGTFSITSTGSRVSETSGWATGSFSNTVAGGLTGGPLGITIDTTSTGLISRTYQLVWNGLQTNFAGGNWFGTASGQNSFITGLLTVSGNVIDGPVGNPEPGILWLFGSAGLGWYINRRKKSDQA